MRSRIEGALKNVFKKNIEYQRRLEELEVSNTVPAVIVFTHQGSFSLG